MPLSPHRVALLAGLALIAGCARLPTFEPRTLAFIEGELALR